MVLLQTHEHIFPFQSPPPFFLMLKWAKEKTGLVVNSMGQSLVVVKLDVSSFKCSLKFILAFVPSQN